MKGLWFKNDGEVCEIVSEPIVDNGMLIVMATNSYNRLGKFLVSNIKYVSTDFNDLSNDRKSHKNFGDPICSIKRKV